MSGNPNLQVPDEAERAKMSREELGALGMALDGVELAEYGERYVPGSPADKRAERQVAKWFLLAALFAVLFVVAFIWWPPSRSRRPPTEQLVYALYTPIIGVTLGATHPVLRHRRRRVGQEDAAARGRDPAARIGHVGRGRPADAGRPGRWTPATRPGIKRRGMLKGSLLLAGGGLGIAARRAGPRRLHQEPVGGAGRLPAVGHAVGAGRRRHQGPAGADRRHPGPPGGPRGRLDGHGVPGRARRRQGLRRRRHAVPGAVRLGDPDPGRPAGLPVRRLLRLLEDLHARRLPGVAVRAADRPGAVPVPPVAVQSLRGHVPGLRPGHPAAPPAARSSWTTRGTSSRPEDFIEAVGPGFWENGKFPAWYSEPKEATG